MAFFVVASSSSFGPPSSADCKAAQSKYGLEMPVLYDPTNALQSSFGWSSDNGWTAILSQGMHLELSKKHPPVGSTDALIDSLLAQ